MPWCPKCKYEYVEGKTVCPDCKCELVDSLNPVEDTVEEPSLEEFEENEEDFTELLEEKVLPELQNMSEEDLKALYDEVKNRKSLQNSYKPIEDQYKENKSSVGVLLVVGIAGIVVLVLNALGVIHLPLKGFSETLLYIVMGLLFVSFVYSGIRSFLKAKKLFPLVEKEKKQMEDLLEFAISQANAGMFKEDTSISYEENAIILSDQCVTKIESSFDDLPEGLAFYVTDRNFDMIFKDILHED